MEAPEEPEGALLAFLLWPVDHPWGIALFALAHFGGLAAASALSGAELGAAAVAGALAWTCAAGAAIYLVWPAGADPH